jgi:hypothetical protein
MGALRLLSGIGTLTQRICPCVRSHGSSKQCYMRNVSSRTMCTISLGESRKMASIPLDFTGMHSEPLTEVSFPSITGSGAVYSFDPVGSYEREACRAAGAASSLIQPFLDNQVRIIFQITTYDLHLPIRLPDSRRLTLCA